jgi:FtsH-binding integral membrane protein
VKQHLKNVYSVFSMALLAAALGAYVHLYTRVLQAGLLTLIGSIVLLILLSTTPHSPLNTKKRLGYFLSFAGLAGVSLGPLLDAVIQINPSIIPTAFLGTAIIFICFSVSALMTNQKTFIYLGGMLFSGLFLISTLSLLNIFFGSRLLYDVNLYGGFLIFCGFVLFDTQMIIEKRRMGDTDYIWHCMDLFVDFIAIFKRLLIILAEKDRKKSRD